MKFPSLLTLCLAVLAILTPARAIEIRFINWDGDAADLKFLNKGKAVGIHASESSLSPVFNYDGTGPLVLFKEIVVEGKTVRRPAATLAVPAGLTHGIVVLAATDATLETYAGVWIDDSPERRPAGSVRMVNLSSHLVSFKVDTAEFSVAPSGDYQVPVRANVRRVLMQAATQVDGRWKVVANNPLPVRNGLRLLVLLRDGRPQEGSEVNVVDLLSFYDLPPALPGEKMAASSR